MANNFWLNLEKPILALAPMAGFTDSAFRQICRHFGAQVVYSEMASATALAYNPEKTLKMLKFAAVEQPYVVQLFGSNPAHFAQATKLITEGEIPVWLPKKENKKAKKEEIKIIRPAGIDINFGCPVPKVLAQSAGAALMDNIKLAREIIKAVINNTDLAVSIKIRAKGREVDALKFLGFISDLDIKAVMIHGRSLSQGFSGKVDTQIIKKARSVFGRIILANGGIFSAQDAIDLLKKTNADGLGIARGALGRPWIFSEIRKALKTKNKMPSQQISDFDKIKQITLKQARLAYELKAKQGIIQMRKHLCYYIHGVKGAKKLRQQLVKVENLKDIEMIFEKYKK